MTASIHAAAPAAPITEYPPLKANRTYQLILAGHLISILGDGFHSVAMGLWVLQTTGSAKAMSLVLGVRIVIGILFGTVAGTVVDRSDRRRIMWMMDLLRGALVLLLAAVVARPGASLLPLLLLTALIGLASQFRQPAFSASLIHIVGKENVHQAGSTMQMLATISRVTGPMLGGALIALYGGWSAFAVDAGTFLLSGAAVLLAGHFPSPVATGKQRKPFWQDLTTGLTHIRENPLVLALTILSPAINFFGNAYVVLLQVLAIQVWKTEPGAFGTLEAMFPLGLGAGAALLTALPRNLRHRGWWISGLAFLKGPVIVAIALMPGVTPALAVVALLGALVNIATPLSMAAAGFLSDSFGPGRVMVAAGIGLALVGLFAGALRGLRNYD